MPQVSNRVQVRTLSPNEPFFDAIFGILGFLKDSAFSCGLLKDAEFLEFVSKNASFASKDGIESIFGVLSILHKK